ncbi:hypothetical protein [Cryobacterium sp. TMT3-29-2]|uniref:hypothetical protein n=1 Tax=Cryobacterium sp. TMT3-29-2 TaxID=2555867 RepID=UPI0010734E8C|nr:hypothetical protein [Cryobacterium sp. TMT3-29-2]TFC88116.1 hypothetical protein E3O67_08275 [Cryobacterium sp. TMT3-29-2]
MAKSPSNSFGAEALQGLARGAVRAIRDVGIRARTGVGAIRAGVGVVVRVVVRFSGFAGVSVESPGSGVEVALGTSVGVDAELTWVRRNAPAPSTEPTMAVPTSAF